MCAPPAAARPESGEAVMASSTASSVRPPRPKKEPQALVIPKNAAEEQKLKLERLMKNPVQALGLAVENSMCTGICVGESISDKTTWMPWLRRSSDVVIPEDWERGINLFPVLQQKLDAEFQKRLERNKIAAEEQTAKRRKKRQKLKEKKLLAKKMKLEQKKQKEGSSQSQEQPSSSSEEASGTEEEEEQQPSFITGR
ncbi:PRKR-interacting protein 1 isoform X2 [Canis lupus familiaris]|uniref:PRKR-interacting protein 1 isoform X2 n=1 Tax=Canis lupus familiaris TaxID=9615 RepID=UPI000BAA0860|nr:PRKR-interacting protein 1 isoform X2 [Canis lupus familiaris]|eukprot:XP_022275312.1 PRKR-interacting protein 1 isoform X2 [Canis lupus familiaris]